MRAAFIPAAFIAALTLMLVTIGCSKPAEQTPISAEQIAGSTIVREAPGPDDTLRFTVTLNTDGSVHGTGDVSGAIGISYLSNGNWSIRTNIVRLTLTFIGYYEALQSVRTNVQAITIPGSNFTGTGRTITIP
ncbi:MAG: hypothetical protein AABZ39_17360 [Spirochaetota bacterium]